MGGSGCGFSVPPGTGLDRKRGITVRVVGLQILTSDLPIMEQ
jgi:hypothetical protein